MPIPESNEGPSSKEGVGLSRDMVRDVFVDRLYSFDEKGIPVVSFEYLNVGSTSMQENHKKLRV